MVSDGGVAGTHPPSTLHFFVGDECVLIGVGSALISAPILPRAVLGVAGGPPARLVRGNADTAPLGILTVTDSAQIPTPNLGRAIRGGRRTRAKGGPARRVMATRRAKEAFDKAEQERRVAEQREVLRQRAAQRAKDRADERRHGGAFQPKNTREKRGGDGATRAGANLPLGPQRTGASWGLPATQWTGDVGGELVNLKSEVATLRAQRARWEAERVAMEDQLAKRRAALGDGAPSPPPGSVASPVSARDGEDVRVDAAPAARGGGRSVDFKHVSGSQPATDPAEYDDDYAAMLTAEEEALRARTALMQRDAELARARARERELAAALDLARRGAGTILASGDGVDVEDDSLPRTSLPPAPQAPAEPSPKPAASSPPKFDPLGTLDVRRLSPRTEAEVRELQMAARGALARRSEEFAPAALNASLRLERSDRQVLNDGTIDPRAMNETGTETNEFDVTNVSSLTATQLSGVEAMQAAARDHLARTSGAFADGTGFGAASGFGQLSVRTVDVESDHDDDDRGVLVTSDSSVPNLGDSFQNTGRFQNTGDLSAREHENVPPDAMMAFMRAEFDALRREMRSERELAVSFLGAQLATNDDDPAPGVANYGSGVAGGANAIVMTEMRAMRRELRLERERAQQVEARQRRELEQTRKAADAAVATAESVANLQKTHMRLVMKAAETRNDVMDKLVPNRKTARVAVRGKYDAADIADEALKRIASSNVPVGTGDGVEEQQEAMRRRRFERHASRLGQIAAAASALAVATVRANAAAAAEEEKRKRDVATLGKTAEGSGDGTPKDPDEKKDTLPTNRKDDTVDKFMFAKVMTDYFLPVVLLSPEEKAAAEEKRRRDKLAAVEQQRRWAVAAEREGTYGRSAHSWQARRDAVAAEKEATDTIVWALAHAEKLVVKTLKKQRRSLLECESSGRVDAVNKGRMGAECRGVVTGAVADCERICVDALDSVKNAVEEEIRATQTNGFMSEDDRLALDARLRRLCALVTSLLDSFAGEIKAAASMGSPEDAFDPSRPTAADNVAPVGLLGDALGLMRPAAGRVARLCESIRADAASAASDQTIPLRSVLDRVVSIVDHALPRCYKPILKAVGIARNMGKFDEVGYAELLIGVDAANRSVSAALEQVGPAVAYAVWQTKHTKVGPGAYDESGYMKAKINPKRPSDACEAKTEEMLEDERLSDKVAKIHRVLLEARDALWIKVDAVKKELEREMCGYDFTEVPALPAWASNGALAIVRALADATEGWRDIIDDAAEFEAGANGGHPAAFAVKLRTTRDAWTRRIRAAGESAKHLVQACTEIYDPMLANPPPPKPPPANNAVPFLDLETKRWVRTDDPEEIPDEPEPIGYLQLEEEVDAACAAIAKVGEDAAARIETIAPKLTDALLVGDDALRAKERDDPDEARVCGVNDLRVLASAAKDLETAVRDALDDLTEDAKDAAAMVKVTAAPPKWEPPPGYKKKVKIATTDPDELEGPQDRLITDEDLVAAGARIRKAEKMARMNVETAIDKTKAVVIELLQARALNTGADIEPRAWRTMPPPRCPYVVELAPKLPAALVPFAGSAAGLSGFEATAQISKNMRDKKDQIAATAREGAKVVAERDLEAARIEALRPPDAVPEPEPEVIPPPRVTPRDLFALLRNHFAPDGNATTGLRETFHRFDDDGDGALTRVQFRDFVKSAIPDATPRELRHFEHLSVGDGDAPVSLNVLREALRGAQRAFKASKIRAAAVDPRAPAMPDRVRDRAAEVIAPLEGVLIRLKKALDSSDETPREIFDRFDVDEDEHVTEPELKAIVKSLVPTFTADEIRMAMAHVFEHGAEARARFDEDGVELPPAPDGAVAWLAFNDAIRAMNKVVT